MDLSGKTVWQHAVGDPDHDHADLCLKWDVIVTGPGTKPWGSYTADEKRKERAEVRRFCDEMREGDVVLLKVGLRGLRGIGLVGGYEHVDEFNDIDGWELGHVRRVKWLHRERHDFGANAFTRSTTTRLNVESAPALIRELLGGLDDSGGRSDLKPLDFRSEGGGDLDAGRDRLAAHLFEQGMSGDAIRELLDPNGSFLQLANWYWNQWASEHETVCNLVVPLLRVLGWTPQRIALEHNRIDVALFSRLPRTEQGNLAAVVEAKALHKACLGAFEQAKGYAKQYSNCKRIIVTDGLRFGVFVREGKEWPENPKPYVYLNVRRLRSGYPIYQEGKHYELRGAGEAIHAMTPGWSPDIA